LSTYIGICVDLQQTDAFAGLVAVAPLKHEILLKSGVSYLEYLEIRAEIERLNGLKETFLRRVDKLKQQDK